MAEPAADGTDVTETCSFCGRRLETQIDLAVHMMEDHPYEMLAEISED